MVRNRIGRPIWGASMLAVAALVAAACSSQSSTGASSSSASAMTESSSEAPAGESSAAASDTAAGVTCEAPQDIKLEVIFYAQSIPYFQATQAGMQAEADRLGVQINFTSANYDVAKESDLVLSALTRDPSGIALSPLDPKALIPAVQKAHEQGVPVVTFGDELAPEAEDYLLSYVGQSYKDMGVMKAEFLAEALGGKGTVLVIPGVRGVDFSESQRAGYEEVFAQYPDIKVVVGTNGDFSSDHGLKATQNLLAANPQPNAVWFDNDDIAFGGIQALKQAGVDPTTVLTVSSDGIKDAIDKIKSGELSFTMASRPFLNGEVVVRTLVDNACNDTVPGKYVEIGMIGVDKTNADSLTNEDIIDLDSYK